MTLGIRTRLYGIVVVFTVGLCVTAWMLLSLEFDALKSRRQQELKGLVETASSLVNAQYELAKSGVLSEADAKAHAAEAVGKLRYQGDNYFWINDMHPTMVMHPVRADLNGKDLTAIKDPNGLALFVEFAKVAGESGSGFVDYMWPKPGFDQPVEKTSYVALFKPWGWIVGTGVYDDDIAAERDHATKTAGAVGIPIVLLVVGIAFFSARSITRRMKKLNAATVALAGGVFDIDLADGGRSDEIGVIFGALEHFREVAIEKNQGRRREKKDGGGSTGDRGRQSASPLRARLFAVEYDDRRQRLQYHLHELDDAGDVPDGGSEDLPGIAAIRFKPPDGAIDRCVS